MFVIVEVCDVNPASTLEWEALEKEFPGLSVILHPCLSHCEICAEHFYAFVDGELITADTSDALAAEIRRRAAVALAEGDQ